MRMPLHYFFRMIQVLNLKAPIPGGATLVLQFLLVMEITPYNLYRHLVES
jgi:hypothetical protein